MRFLILALVLVLFATPGAEACGSAATGRSGLFARFRERRQLTGQSQSQSYRATIRVSSVQSN